MERKLSVVNQMKMSNLQTVNCGFWYDVAKKERNIINVNGKNIYYLS